MTDQHQETKSQRIHRQRTRDRSVPPNASVALRYVRGTRAFQSFVRRKLQPKADAAQFARWVLETEPWEFFARRDQLPPDDDDWLIWLYQAGRGAGKTRAGVEWAFARTLLWPRHLTAVISPTVDDLNRVTFDGPSGLMRIVERRPEVVAKVMRRPWEIHLKNGGRLLSYTGEAFNRLRGPQHHSVLIDEIAGMSRVAKDVYEQASFGLRLNGPNGEKPRMVLTSTPKPLPLFFRLADRVAAGDKAVRISRATMMDNAANLSAEMIAELRAAYEGTRLGEQELYGKLLRDLPGALWNADSFLPSSFPDPSTFDRIVVGVDPAGAASATSDSDEIGIVVAGARYGQTRMDDRFWVLQDATMIGSPFQWGQQVARMYKEWTANHVVAETNYGGAMVVATIKAADPAIPVRVVTASRGKAVRAEPVASLYEQGRVMHCGRLEKLEAQMCGCSASGYVGQGSPDRLDAAVWTLTDLMDRTPPPVVASGGPVSESYWIPNVTVH